MANESVFDIGLNRRRWLISAALIGMGASQAEKAATSEGDVDSVLRLAKKAGLKNFGTSTREKGRYVAVGDASEAFRERALTICEALAETFQKHFAAKGFMVSFPKRKLLIVTLAGPKSYETLIGEPVEIDEGGHYDVDAKRLVVFDFRGEHGRAGRNAERTNSFTLVHEAIHQLSFTTGLLESGSDVPLALSEGLATYGELSPIAKPAIGRVNVFRLEELKRPREGLEWIPLEKLLTDDSLFSEAESQQLAYAEAWLFVYELLQKKGTTRKLQAYLDLVRTRRDPGKRLEDARAALGDLDELDNQLKRRGNLLR